MPCFAPGLKVPYLNPELTDRILAVSGDKTVITLQCPWLSSLKVSGALLPYYRPRLLAKYRKLTDLCMLQPSQESHGGIITRCDDHCSKSPIEMACPQPTDAVNLTFLLPACHLSSAWAPTVIDGVPRIVASIVGKCKKCVAWANDIRSI